jgi:hypothetical protein
MICNPKNEATLPHLFQEKIDYYGLHKNNGGNAESELLVLGFVTR